MPLPIPDPPLTDGVVRLRPWSADDADVLAAAWADPEIQRWTAVPPPERRSETDARRWIAGEALRRERNVALDLAIAPADVADRTVLGEVGLVVLAGGPGRAEVGWWVGPLHRRRGIASRAVALFAAWAREELGFELFADVDPDNPPSVWVAEKAGLRLRLRG